jgi:glycosyltransferase involved in cell wall biosynthesis
MWPSVSVVVPTREEAANVFELHRRVAAVLRAIGVEWELVYVDDSDDETPRVVRELAHESESVRLLHRPPNQRVGGLAGALAIGLCNARGDVVVVMDGDLQHPPETIGRLLPPLLMGEADVSIGSRYIPGGGCEGLGGPWRRTVSVTSKLLSYAVFPEVRAVSDPGSGLFGLRREVIDGVVLRPEGFKMLLELLVRGSWERAYEFPYAFGGRMYGASKTTMREGTRFLRHVGRLWWTTRLGGDRFRDSARARLQERSRNRRRSDDVSAAVGNGSASANTVEGDGHVAVTARDSRHEAASPRHEVIRIASLVGPRPRRRAGYGL